ncbi:MAG: DUF819 family protein [Oscillospiraceae bacterium]|nr:DUF819 family protein [Oscillospiraceae bacterium]MBQ1804266.1 DUF819 family protein [Oscillospiraceae bacterium]
MITNGFTYMAVLLFMAAVLVTLEKSAKGGMQKFFKFIPAVVLCYLIAMLLCTLNVWDLAETKPAYSALKNNLTYAMIFAMLLRCDIRKVLRLGPKMLVGFFSATFTIMIGFIVAFTIMKGTIGSNAWMGLGALCGSWIGGSGNMVAVQAALDISESDMGYALVIDSIDYSLWVMFLLWAIQLAPKFNKWTKADTSKLDEVSSRLEEEAKMNTKPVTFQSLILLIGTAFLVSAIATNVGAKLYGLTNFSDKATWTVLFVTAVALIAAVTPLGKVAGSAEVSNLLLYSVIGLLASRASLLELGDAPAWILTGFIVLLVHSVLMLIICKVLKLDLFTAGVASLANIGGTASAPVLAGSYSGSLVPVGILMALMGYVVGTPLAVVCANIMKSIA